MVYEQMKLKSFLRHTLLLVTISASAIIVRADGGVLLWQQTTGSITVTAFTTQSPLRTGPVDISFLIENNEQSRPILDARLFVVIEDESGATIRSEATHDQARNKLLYCSPMNLTKAGRWKISLIVMHGGEKNSLVNEVQVIEAQSPLIAHWKLLAFPFTLAILFVFHQRLAWKRSLPRAT